MKFSAAFVFLTTVLYAFGQAQTAMSPKEVTAGKNITITVTLDKAPSVERTSLNV